jgi:hypothetical protein
VCMRGVLHHDYGFKHEHEHYEYEYGYRLVIDMSVKSFLGM